MSLPFPSSLVSHQFFFFVLLSKMYVSLCLLSCFIQSLFLYSSLTLHLCTLKLIQTLREEALSQSCSFDLQHTQEFKPHFFSSLSFSSKFTDREGWGDEEGKENGCPFSLQRIQETRRVYILKEGERRWVLWMKKNLSMDSKRCLWKGEKIDRQKVQREERVKVANRWWWEKKACF